VGARLLTSAADDVRAGRTVRDTQRLVQLQGVMRDMGLTERSTISGLRTAETEAGAVARGEGGAASHAPGGVTPPPPPGGRPGGGAGGGGARRFTGITQQQRAAALRTEAAGAERRIAGIRAEIADIEARAATSEPARASRLRATAGARRAEVAEIERQVPGLRQQADDFEHGRVSATADLPGADEVERMFEQIESGPFIYNLRGATADELAHQLRPIMRSRTGNRVVFRVEGGGGRSLITINEGNVTFRRTGSSVHLNFGSEDRALEFLRENRGSRGRIVAFEVPEDWVRSLQSGAIPELGTTSMGRSLRNVDIRRAADQFEIPPSLVDELEQLIIPGSGRQVDVTLP
jgi:hypothetical protein